jgi:hypothetical protein
MSRGARRRVGTPCVIFLDDTRWAAFHQLAPLLRRAGVRTVRVSAGAQTGSRFGSRLVYDRYEVLSGASEAGALRRILEEENVIDIQFVERFGAIVRPNLGVLDAGVAERVARRLAVQDKLSAAQLFHDSGVRTPAVVPVTEASPGAVAARFGFPVVVKARVGSAGTNVIIAGDVESLIAAATAPDGDPEDRYYEQYVYGEKLNYAAAATSADIEQELAYRVIRWLEPAGTAFEVQTISDPQLEAFGRRAIAVAGCTGLMNMDVIRDTEGRDWLIDFNSRAFGGAVCFRAAGIDMSQGYLRAIGMSSTPPACASPRADVRFRVFPTCLGEAISSGRMMRTAVLFVRESWPYLRWVGIRYWLSEALAIADSVRTARRARAQRDGLRESEPTLAQARANETAPPVAR